MIAIQDLIHDRRRDDQHPVAFADKKVARCHSYAANAHGHLIIDTQHQRTNTGSMAATQVDARRHGSQIRNIAHASVHQDSGAAAHQEASGHHGARYRGVRLTPGVEYQHIAGLGFFGGAII